MPSRVMRYGLWPSAVDASTNTETTPGRYSGKLAHSRLPVLEHVAPVALVVHDRPTVVVGHPDRELVPRPARVAVAAREAERQVLDAEADQVGSDVSAIRSISSRRSIVAGRPASHPAWRSATVRLRCRTNVAKSDVSMRYPSSGDATPHHVVGDVRDVMGARHGVARPLGGIDRRHDPYQVLTAATGRLDRCRGGWTLTERSTQRGDVGVVATHVGDDVPRCRRPSGELELTIEEVRAGHPGDQADRFDLATGVERCDAPASRVTRPPNPLDHATVARSTSSGSARSETGASSEYTASPASIDQLAALVGVREVAERAYSRGSRPAGRRSRSPSSTSTRTGPVPWLVRVAVRTNPRCSADPTGSRT
jgi:hypothetical protein